METAATKSGAERTSLNEFQMLKFFKSKWKRFWIISLINIWANIAVTKHVLLADEFVPYRPRLLGFHSLHVNAMKCIYVGFSLSKLQSFFWKISLNSCLIRLEGFNNKTSTELTMCPTWTSGEAFARSQAAQTHYMNEDVTLACERCCVTNGYFQRLVWDRSVFLKREEMLCF